LVKGPYTNPFPKMPHKPFERFRGRPYFHDNDCMGCSACAQVCPTGAIEFKDVVLNGKGKRIFTVHWDVCIFCGQCQANCPTAKGIVLSQEFDFATCLARTDLKQEMEKDLLLCECCGEMIVPYDQYAWVSQKLGPLCFSNASLILFVARMQDLALTANPAAHTDSGLARSDRVKILCPRCRREAVLKS